MPVTVVNVGYRSTNFWVVSNGTMRLLVDLGWPGTMGTMRANLQRAGVPLSEIRYGLATHYHPDHAGLAQELKLAGVPILMMDVQVALVPVLATIVKPTDGYVDVTMQDNVTVSCEASRSLLASVGFSGEIIHTPGHSDDSVSLLLDDGAVFTGDLTPPFLAVDDDQAAVLRDSWGRLRERGATRIYPGHGSIRPMDAGITAPSRAVP